ncbi:SDR family oxidoreductase [Aspergillus homomorphus CBS 101889]|uniref:Short chain oxidoreductase n=1 Tax=Aspergillus homomorphus (strain CBS 101889) TaxID=1450537 RepID=A0A395I945_ASPHC|nr:short chain oxidoreductase [Aspergillus homomorphus CBS 101889]RAL16790.1 short chain oxidoreductase [Aspergillus homomorphus CBS 101889]
MTTYLITGATRGIGLELTRQLAAKPATEVYQIFAGARSSPSHFPPDFQTLLREHASRITPVQLDVTDENGVRRAAQSVSEALQGRGLDVLINNAGVMGRGSLEEMNDLTESFEVNVNGPHLVTREFLPLLRRGQAKKIVNISTTVGSFGLQSLYREAKSQSYKITKAALNMLTVLYSQELEKEGFAVFCVSPGWLQTELGGARADLPVDVGVRATLDIILNKGKEGNGRFFNIHIPGWDKGWNRYDGGESPW